MISLPSSARILDRLALSVTLCVLAILSPISAADLGPLDFQINDEASYQSFTNAVIKTEYVRNAYVQAPKPRVIGGVAGIVHYATDNPLASTTQLTAFVTEYDARLAAHAPGDADLQRGSHLVSAVRFELPLAGIVGLEGTNTNLGSKVVDALGIGVPAPTSYQSNERRIVRFEQARLRALSESPVWANLLTVGFSGQDLLGNPNANLAGVLQTYLEGEGYSPLAPCSGCTDIGADVLSALPVDYIAYQALLADVYAPGGIVDNITAGYAAVNLESTDRVEELRVIMTNEPSLVQAAANANNVAFVTLRQAQYLANLAKVADERAIINVNAMLLAQAPDASTQLLGDKAQRFASVQISQNKDFAQASEFVQIAGGINSFALAAFADKRDPVAMVGGVTDIITGALGLGSLFGGGEEDDQAEQAIIDQMVAMRDQLSDVQFQLNGRFNRIETQLNVVFTEVIDGFDRIGTQLDDLQIDLALTGDMIEDLELDLVQANASLDRIEDALWVVGDAILTADLTTFTNAVLNFRVANGIDLDYSDSSTNFVDSLSDLHSFATDIAVNSIFGGDPANPLTVASAASDPELNTGAIGRQINGLRVFPTMLGQSPLLNHRVPAPSAWTQAASTYAQVARENPWYFAYKNGNSTAQFDSIVEFGNDIDFLASNTRRQALFDTLFDAWRTELEPVTSEIYAAVVDPVVVGGVDLGGPLRDIAVSGDVAVAANVFSLNVMFINGTHIFLHKTLPISVDVVAVRGDLALATGGGVLYLIDVSFPSLSSVVGSVNLPATGRDIAISGDLAFVTGSVGLMAIDISDATAPMILGTVDTGSNGSYAVKISGDLAYTNGNGFDLGVIDISDPNFPGPAADYIVGTIDLPLGGNFAISGDLAVMASGQFGLQLIDISDPNFPGPAADYIVGNLEYPCCTNDNAKDVIISGELAYVAKGVAGLAVVDISDPAFPFELDGVGGPFRDARAVAAMSGDLVLVGYESGGPILEVIEIYDWQGANWQGVLNQLNGSLLNTKTNLQGYQNLVEAYITLGMPDLMEESPIVRAALRSDASKGELAVGPIEDIFSGYIMEPFNVTGWQVPANLQRLQDEVNAAIANPSVGHGYVDYMLAELDHLSNNASKLANDDAYFTPPGGTLTVLPDAGLLANDVKQGCRLIEVDLNFLLDLEYVAPQNGSLTLSADGSFEYIPDAGFEGQDLFTYRAFTGVGDSGPDCLLNPLPSTPLVYSDPATVVVVVGAGTTVLNTNDAGSGSLRAAIANTPAGEVISFDQALDGQPILLTSQLVLTENVSIDASSLPNGLILDGGGITRVMQIAAGVEASIKGLTITGGNANGNGGGIDNQGVLNLIDVSLIDNHSSTYGGAIINFGATVTMERCTLTDNTAGFSGGAIYNGNDAASSVTLINSTLFNNSSVNNGGAVYNFLGQVTVIHSTILGNSSGTGGGIANNAGTLSVENSIFAGNTFSTSTADIWSSGPVFPTGENFVGDNTTVTAAFPEGPFVGTLANPKDPLLFALGNNGGPTDTMLPMFGSPVIDAAITIPTLTTDQRGEPRPSGSQADIGAVEVSATYGMVTNTAEDLSDGSLRQILNIAPDGFTVNFAPSLDGQTILLTSQLDLTRNVNLDASSLPNGLVLDGGGTTRVLKVLTGVNVSIKGITITGGNEASNGGGIWNRSGVLSLIDVGLVDNHAVFGGALLNSDGGTATLTRCTLSGNTADISGGAIYNGNDAATSVTLINSTMFDNSSVNDGGAIVNSQGNVSLVHTTVSGNSAGAGGGVISFGGTVQIENSIIAGNTATAGAADISTSVPVLPVGENFIGDNTSVSAVFPEGPFVGTNANPKDPLLLALANYGGPTDTMLPSIDSPVLNAAITTAGLLIDQRGEPRLFGPQPDMGAVELQQAPPPPNDGFFNPVALPGNGGSEQGTLFGATRDGASSVDPIGFPDGTDVWYQFVAPANGTLRVNTCGSLALSNINTVLSVHTDDGGPGTLANELAANDEWETNGDPTANCPGFYDSSVALSLSVGDAVLIRVSRGDNIGELEFALNVSFEISVDTDSDGVADSVDNCTLVANSDQRDTNGDGFGNICDPDLNNDGVVNFIDISSWAPLFNTVCGDVDADFNGDGVCNFGDYAMMPGFFGQPPGPSGLVP